MVNIQQLLHDAKWLFSEFVNNVRARGRLCLAPCSPNWSYHPRIRLEARPLA